MIDLCIRRSASIIRNRDARSGSKADIGIAGPNVRFWGKSGRQFHER